MGWDTIAFLIATQGIPFVERLIKNWSNKTPVTPEEWNELLVLSQQTPRLQMIAALNRAGIPLDSQKALDLLALVPV